MSDASTPLRDTKLCVYDSRPIWQRLDVSVTLGAVVGLIYAVVDARLDHGASAGPFRPDSFGGLFHSVVDLVLPPLVGGLVGLCVHYLQVRGELASIERRRAESLVHRLQKIQRDQAVWAISASLLHELKNPLHALGLLLDEVSELPAAAESERQTLLGRARVQSDKISQRLGSLRVLSSDEAPELPLIDLRAEVSVSLASFQPTFRAKGVRSTLARAPQIHTLQTRPTQSGSTLHARANPAYVRIILDNLLDNAVEAFDAPEFRAACETEPRSPEISIQLFHEASRSIVEIQDNGPGFGSHDIEQLFEPLRTSKSSGLGLGLAVSRALCRSMGGDLRAISSTRGANFRVELPNHEDGAA
jgi:two-component system sensor kinase FixL